MNPNDITPDNIEIDDKESNVHITIPEEYDDAIEQLRNVPVFYSAIEKALRDQYIAPEKYSIAGFLLLNGGETITMDKERLGL